jgi:predicted nucleotidyltransferase
LKLGLLKSKKQGKNVVLSANYDVGDFITMKKWTNIFLLIDSNLVKDTQDKVSTLILFGSFSRGEDIEKSDIDLAVDKELDINLDKYEGILNRNIQFHVINKSMGSNLKENIGQGILLSGVAL